MPPSRAPRVLPNEGQAATREENVMPQYIWLGTWTDQGIKNVKESPQRVDANRKLWQEEGGRIVSFHMTMGAYDMVALIEAPNDEAMARVSLKVAQGGNVRGMTLKAFSEDEYRKILSSVG
jgi:uncharacterized protein with GYD domain